MGAHAEVSAVDAGGSSRRRLLAMLGVGGVAVVANQIGAPPAGAGHDATNVFHLGATNTAPGDATTSLETDVEAAGLEVENISTVTSTGMRGIGGQAGVEGVSDAGNGVVGRRTSVTDDDGLAGVLGECALGSGVVGHATVGVGVSGHCDEGAGVLGFGSLEAGAFEFTPGVAGFGFSDHGVIGQTERPDRAGVRGEAHSCLQRGSEDPEDPCNEPSPGTGVHGKAEAGIGVRGESDSGPGVEAESASGLALRVVGAAGFSAAGTGTVPQGASSTFVADALVDASSHVLVVLTSDPGSRHLGYVAPTAGGFTVHLSSAPPGRRVATSFSYLAVQTA